MKDMLSVGTVLIGSLLVTQAAGQALLRGPREARVEADGKVDTRASLREVSLYMVEAPKPKTLAIHDLVTIIISETSKTTSQQKLDTKTDSSLKGGVNKFPDIGKLLTGELTSGGSNPVATVDVSGNEKFKGDATYERNDKFTDKISAEVIDIKPNGTLLLEARRTITKDKEIQVVLLSGSCRREDVTNGNTVLSSQLADLTLNVQNEGELKDNSQPGWITRLFRTVFDF